MIFSFSPSSFLFWLPFFSLQNTSRPLSLSSQLGFYHKKKFEVLKLQRTTCYLTIFEKKKKKHN